MRRLALLVFVLVIGITVLSETQALGQEGRAGDVGGVTKIYDHFVAAGGPITWCILIPLSVATIALTVEHLLSIRRATVIPDEAVDRLTDMLERKQYAEALEYASDEDSTLSHVIRGGLSEVPNGFAAVERAMEETLDERAARLTRKIEYLNVIGNVSPMIGLFGTVVGMIRLFGSIGGVGGNLEAGQMADDISIALVTTFWGLLVAIPALSIFALFRNRIEVLTAECALVAERLMAVFKPVSEAPSAGVASPARVAS